MRIYAEWPNHKSDTGVLNSFDNISCKGFEWFEVEASVF